MRTPSSGDGLSNFSAGIVEGMRKLSPQSATICPRAVAGMAEMPFNSPLIIEGEVEIRS